MISSGSTQKYLQLQLDIVSRARKWLLHSLQKCQSINLDDPSNDYYDSLEALSSRYGRFVAILINKLFRAVDQFELMDAGTLIDTLNRAEKRGIVSSKTGRELKELRNTIVHEYDPEVVAKLAGDIIQYAQIAISANEQLESYLVHEYGLGHTLNS